MIKDPVIQPIRERNAHVTRAALALDSLIVNGIQFGILNEMAPRFLEKTSDELHVAVEVLCDATNAHHPDGVKTLCEELRRTTQQLISLLGLLRTFRDMEPSQVRAACKEVRLLRDRIVNDIQDAEAMIERTDRFYDNRSIQSSAAIDYFLAELENSLLTVHNAGAIASPA